MGAAAVALPFFRTVRHCRASPRWYKRCYRAAIRVPESQWNVGDTCLATIGTDKELVTGKIFEIHQETDDPGSRQYAIVSFADHSEETIWLEDLQPPKQDNLVWRVNNFCRAKWSEDEVIYESKIIEIADHDGKMYAVVEFLGYGNQDSVYLTDLMPTEGDNARKAQLEASQAE